MDRIRIDQVVTDRDLDAAEPLPADPAIVRVPIIVTNEMVLVDGLRRLKFWRDSGVKTVLAIVVSNVDEAYAAIGPQQAGRTLKPQQMWNILRIVYPWGVADSARKRAFMAAESRHLGVKRKVKGLHNTPLRMRMVEMLNASSGHVIERTIYLYRAADNGNTLAQQMVQEVNEGKKSVYTAADVVTRGNVFRGSIREINEQKTLLDNGARNLGAQIGALLKLGSPVVVDTEDLESAIQALVASRSKLATFINQLKAVHRERTHG